MPRPNPRYEDRWQDLDSIWHTETPKDIWLDLGGRMTRNYAVEKRMMNENIRVQQYNTNFKPESAKNGIGFNPTQLPMYGGSDYSLENLVEYKKQAIEYLQAGIELGDYRCHKYPRDPAFCGYAGEDRNRLSILQGSLSRIEGIIAGRIVVPGYEQYTNGILESVLPSASAEEDPSVNSGLNGNEQETQVINYPQSANVRIIISNISMFSTSIPINDIGQLQALSNASNEWRYTLIGSSTNQPLMTLSGLINKINSMIASAVVTQPPVIEPPVIEPPIQPPIEEEPVTTDHIPPPEVEPEVPMVTVTPTEPGQVNWIPEPFFSIINNVFRR